MEEPSKRVFFGLAALVLGVVGLAIYFSQLPQGDDPSRDPDAPPRADRPENPDLPEVPRPPPTKPPVRVTGSHGIVTDESGEPVAGARVFLYTGRPKAPAVDLPDKEEAVRDRVADLFQYYPDEKGGMYPLGAEPARAELMEEPIDETVSDEEGRFRFPRAPFERLRMSARYEGLTSGEMLAMPGKPVTLVLRASAGLRGWVRSADDHRMLGGALVRMVQGGRSILARANSKGDYEIIDLPAGPVMLFATHEEYAGDLKRAVLLSAGRQTEVNFDLTRGYKLTVTVRGMDEDSDDEPPLGDATVGVIRMEDHAYATGVTTTDGVVVFEGLPPGTYLVNASRKDYLPAGEERVPLKASRKWELFLEKAIYTTVRVVDEHDVPIPGADLYTANLDEEYEEKISKKVGVTDTNGEFPFPFDWDGKEAALHIVKQGYGMGIAYPDDPSDGGVITVKLEPGVTLRGRVTDSAMNPVAGATVYIEVTPDDLDRDDVYATLYTNERGEYRFPFLALGDVYVEVTADGYEGDDADFESRVGRSEYVKNFVLEKE